MKRPTIPLVAALALASCKGDGTTGWIPRDGTITGTVTVLAASLTAPAEQARSTRPQSSGTQLALPAPAQRSAAVFRARASISTRTPPRRPAVASNELIVTFRPAALGAPVIGSSALRDAAVGKRLGAAIRARLLARLPTAATVGGVSPAILAARVRVADRSQIDAVAADLRHDPSIASASPDHLIWLDRTPLYRAKLAATATTTKPNNPLYPFQSWHYGLIDLPRAWTVTTGSASVLVGVVDDGIRFDHPAIAPNLTSDGYDFVNSADSLPLCAGGTISNADDGNGPDSDPTNPAAYYPDSTGTCFAPGNIGNHGLHVAATIGAAGNNGIGVAGVNWQVRIRPVRVLGVGGFGSTYDVAQGVLYAAGLPADNGAGGTVQASSGARIINLSLGSAQDDTTLQRAIASAVGTGALVVAAAGNSGSSQLFYPAAYPGVLAVAAVGPDGHPAAYSNFGSYVGIKAPGGNFDLGQVTDGVMSAIWDFSTNSPAYAWAEGTSMAAPHVSGVAALILSQSANLTAADLRSRLITYAEGPADLYGAGLVNAYNSVTQLHGPPTQLYARLYAANTGALVATIPATNGTFNFRNVQDGTYEIFAGTDAGGDEAVGHPGMSWGALGGADHPASLQILGSSPHDEPFSISYPGFLAAHTKETANTLVLDGYMQGFLGDTTMIDVFVIKIPKSGTYTFETSGWVGACGLALEEATAIGIFDSTTKLITSTGYIDTQHYNYCSRLTWSLSPGTYYIGVAGAFGHRYRLQARVGP